MTSDLVGGGERLASRGGGGVALSGTRLLEVVFEMKNDWTLDAKTDCSSRG